MVAGPSPPGARTAELVRVPLYAKHGPGASAPGPYLCCSPRPMRGFNARVAGLQRANRNDERAQTAFVHAPDTGHHEWLPRAHHRRPVRRPPVGQGSPHRLSGRRQRARIVSRVSGEYVRTRSHRHPGHESQPGAESACGRFHVELSNSR